MARLLVCLVVLLVTRTLNATDLNDCGLNQQSRILASLILHDPDQQRSRLVCNELLSKIAETKAREMAGLGRVAHIGKSAANRRLIDAGYPLSRIYPRLLENNVEAIAGGVSSAGEVWQAFKESDIHRAHLLGEHEFYLLQNEIGVGFFEDLQSPHVEYWVVYIAHRSNDEEYEGDIARSKD